MNGKEIKAIFTDLDGTLLDNTHKIMPKTKTILCDLYHANMLIVPVSARMPATITSITDAIDTKLPLIAYNGALCLGSDKKQLFSFTIDEYTSANIYSYIKQNYPDVCICAYFKDDWIVDDITDHRIQTEIKAVGLSPMEIPIDKYIKSAKELHKLFIISEPERVEKLLNEINEKWKNVYACKSRDIFIEITSYEASKGNAVIEYARKTNLNLKNASAFGDQINDIDMLKSVGISVAMGNSVPAVKEAADYVTDTNENEGIYKFLREYIK